MKRFHLAAAAIACLIGAALPGAASAKTVELGQVAGAPIIAPACAYTLPLTECTIVLTRSTGLVTIRDGVDYPTVARSGGDIVAFTVGLSALKSKFESQHDIVHTLDENYGGTTQIAVAILKPVGAHKLYEWQLAAISPVFHVQPYLGTVVQFPLSTPLPIVRGEAVALSIPTWAPLLAMGLTSTDYAYRQDRTSGCKNPSPTEAAMFSLSASNVFGCDYPGTSPEYSATEITTPVPPKSQIHGHRHAAVRHARRRSLRPRVLRRADGGAAL